ncbi:hypothetical protein SAMN05216274_12328 [Cryobacterium levicorallinum]|uniref:Uncharacterized protein n=1 Tax=Cryobacterium levicorallinum TaxID=995038 RepID=A0ABY1EI61_9MICO|nr:hypothetical protein SAMN05216274_12328 [Cryobacterium levicorallinum]
MVTGVLSACVRSVADGCKGSDVPDGRIEALDAPKV